MRESSPKAFHRDHTTDDTLIISEQPSIYIQLAKGVAFMNTNQARTGHRELRTVIDVSVMIFYYMELALTDATPHRYGFCKTSLKPPFGGVSTTEPILDDRHDLRTVDTKKDLYRRGTSSIYEVRPWNPHPVKSNSFLNARFADRTTVLRIPSPSEVVIDGRNVVSSGRRAVVRPMTALKE